MNRRRRARICDLQQQIAVALSLTVISKNGGGAKCVVFPLLLITNLFLVLYRIVSFYHSIPLNDVVYLLQSFQMALWVFWNGMTIITKSILWGCGLCLS